jgi:hypothetical protein
MLGGSPSTMLSLAPRPVDRAGWRAGPIDRAGLVYLAILAALRAAPAGGAIVVSDCRRGAGLRRQGDTR